VTGFLSDEHINILVRPYALTGGRTRPRVDIAIEALVATTPNGRSGIGHQRGSADEHVLALCKDRPLSLAEIAAHTRLPFGVARVLVGDLLTAGLVMMAGRTFVDGRNADVLGQVLRGLRKL
jgi:hypothetical protein